jgi:hypothetical protein
MQISVVHLGGSKTFSSLSADFSRNEFSSSNVFMYPTSSVPLGSKENTAYLI